VSRVLEITEKKRHKFHEIIANYAPRYREPSYAPHIEVINPKKEKKMDALVDTKKLCPSPSLNLGPSNN